MERLSEIWPAIENVARNGGALRAGASGIDDAHAGLFGEWIAAGHAASMSYLERSAAVRANPRDRYPWAQSVIVITVPYSPRRPEAGDDVLLSRVARYALGDDYHDVLDRMLRRIEDAIHAKDPDVKTWRYVDTGPLSDRSYAAQAGLGWVAKNGMLIDEENGSYFFIGTLLTSLVNDVGATAVADRCGTCTRCIDACPTDAILPGHLVAAERCISYLTIEHRGDLPADLAHRLECHVFGCDICQEVCPWNGRAPEGHAAFAPRNEYGATPVTDLLRFEQADFSRLFRKSAIKRAKLAGMQRNVRAVMKSAKTESS
ncbi:MAG: tRNA epoxyqueuosine(34) reductase QueG [Thermoanaerobaculia bacterium]